MPPLGDSLWLGREPEKAAGLENVIESFACGTEVRSGYDACQEVAKKGRPAAARPVGPHPMPRSVVPISGLKPNAVTIYW